MKRLFLLLAVVGCEAAHRDEPGSSPDGGMDPLTCGSVVCDQIPPATCDGDTLREYTAACTDATCSYPSTETECGGVGCCGDHCCEVATSNADTTGTIMPTGLNVAPPNGTFDTDTECTMTSALGQCTVVARTDMPEACVCRMDELTIGTLEIKGTRALVLLAYKTVLVQTTLDLSGDRFAAGPGARGTVYTMGNANGGGAGGSYATKGGKGADGSMPADTYGDATLIPLQGGMKGMNGAGSGTSAGSGGGGGGALQITAGVKIEIPGNIYAGGGGGVGGYWTWGSAGGGGGGSGGAILLEAPVITMTGRLDANGGGGAAAGGDDYYGVDGEDASDEMPSGGYANDNGTGCALDGYIYGGNGGNGATSTTAAGNGTTGGYRSGCVPDAFIGGGGGGGGAGRIRINTTSGCQCSGTVSPSASFGTLGVK